MEVGVDLFALVLENRLLSAAVLTLFTVVIRYTVCGQTSRVRERLGARVRELPRMGGRLKERSSSVKTAITKLRTAVFSGGVRGFESVLHEELEYVRALRANRAAAEEEEELARRIAGQAQQEETGNTPAAPKTGRSTRSSATRAAGTGAGAEATAHPTTTTTTSSTSTSAAAAAAAEDPATVSPANDLVGLALSGGGVRSATFSLGVLQSLSRGGLLSSVDYLSTVSGGGFMGACLCSLLSPLEGSTKFTASWGGFPLKHVPGVVEGKALRKLRVSANYLGESLVDQLTIPVLIVRGVILNMMAVFPFVWGLALIKERAPFWLCTVAQPFDPTSCFSLSQVVASNLLVHIILFPLLSRPFLSFYTLAVAALLYYEALVELVPFFLGPAAMAFWVSVHVYFSWPYLFGVESKQVKYDRSFALFALATLLVVALDALSVVQVHFRALVGSSFSHWLSLGAFLSLLVSISLAVSVVADTTISETRRALSSVVVGVTGPCLLLLFFLQVDAIVAGKDLQSPCNILFLILSFLSLFCLDINDTSLHRFYRDRISHAFLFQVRDKDRAQHLVSVGSRKLSSYLEGCTAPYHIINATLNITRTGSGGATVERACAPFFFSRLFVGSAESGFRRTSTMEAHDRSLDLATSVSVSGAAMSPQMGTNTIRSLIVSLGIINIRLGYWLPNPSGVLLSSSVLSRFFYGFAWISLLKELGYPTYPTDLRVNLTDGGHFENLGAYELIRRKCKFIIIVDGESDVNLQFNGLATLIRLARLDFGTSISINIDDIRKDPATGLSKRRFAVGRVIYHKGGVGGADVRTPFNPNTPPAGDLGYVLYIKATCTGKEDEVIREYRSRERDFPHETTSSQFFSESQWEAYRSLGFAAAGKDIFGPSRTNPLKRSDLPCFFRDLYEQGKLDNAPLPGDWKEMRHPVTGARYFASQQHSTTTWIDPRRHNLV
jgi:hypothetical protein